MILTLDNLYELEEEAEEEIDFFLNCGIRRDQFEEKLPALKERLENDLFVTSYRLPMHPADVIQVFAAFLTDNEIDDEIDYDINTAVELLKERAGVRRLRVTLKTGGAIREDRQETRKAEKLAAQASGRTVTGSTSELMLLPDFSSPFFRKKIAKLSYTH